MGSLLIPVGPPPAAGAEPEMIFAGLAQSVVGTGTDPDAKLSAAITAIFQMWPAKRICSPAP